MQSTLYDVRFFQNNGYHPEIEEKARQEAFFADVMKVNRLMGFDLTDWGIASVPVYSVYRTLEKEYQSSDLLRLTRQDIVNGALEYIKGLMAHLGYANQPYIIVEHNDIERRHFHVVSVRVDENVKGIPTHKEGSKIKEYSIANQERFGFIYGKDPLAEEKTLNIHSRFERGRGWIKDQIRRFASGILKSYSFSTQSQFSKIMRHYGIKAEWKRKEDTSILLCQGLDSQGNSVTRPVTNNIGSQAKIENERQIQILKSLEKSIDTYRLNAKSPCIKI